MNDMKYSDELANGDGSDDKDLHEEEDMNDDVVDYQGQTNAGYASTLPSTHVANNNINYIGPGHFGTIPEANLQVKEDLRMAKMERKFLVANRERYPDDTLDHYY